MIEAEGFTDKFLTCLICQGVYNEPVSLQCGHTYCRKCLTRLIKSRPDAIRDNVIPCALRCEGTRVPEPQTPVETWANQLKPNFIVVNLLDEFTPVTGNDCTNCKNNKTKSPGIKWCAMCRQSLCERCISSHRGDATTRLHTLTDLADRVERGAQQYTRCIDHKDEYLKLICENCNKAICNTCWAKHHKRCASVVVMESKRAQIQANILEHKSKLETDIENQMVNIANCQSNVDKLERIKEDVRSQILNKFQNIIELIKKKESALLRELERFTENEIGNLHDRIQTGKTNLQMYQQRSYFIDKAVNSGSINDMYNIYQSNLSPDRPGWEADIMQSTHRAVTGVELSLNTDQLIDSINKLNFGTIEVRPKNRNVQQMFCNSSVLDGKLPGDGYNVGLHDITVLVIDLVQTVVVTDYWNSCVKSFYTRNNQSCHSKLHLVNPFGITLLNENQVMVAVPYASQIVTVAVTPDLVLLSTITTSKQYESLAAISPNVLAAGCGECVDIINIQGQVMKTVSTHWWNRLFVSPEYMCVTNKGNLLVSDWRKKSVTCLTSKGKVVWIYAPTGDQTLSEPHGITCTTAGDILLVDSHKVIQLTESGQYVRDVFTVQDGLRHPFSICADKDNSIYVCDNRQINHFKFNLAYVGTRFQNNLSL